MHVKHNLHPVFIYQDFKPRKLLSSNEKSASYKATSGGINFCIAFRCK